MRYINEAGNKYGKLTVIKQVGNCKWECVCECGNTKAIAATSLRRGLTSSCGCLHKKICRQPAGDSSYRLLYIRTKNGATSRGYEFSITEEYHRELIQQPCFYCGKEPVRFNAYCVAGKNEPRKNFRYDQETIERSWIKANGIDRYDNRFGYINGNCVSCCGDCNRMKMSMSADAFINHIHRIFNYQNIQQ